MNGFVAQNQNAVLFFPALLLTLWLTPWVIRLSKRIGAVDRPDGRKVHTRTVSRLGGLAMVAGVFVPLLLFRELDRPLVAFLAGALVVAATGLLDDIYRIRPAAKFAGEILGAAVFVFLGGISLSDLGDFLGIGVVHTGALAPAVTVFCMVGVMNALNLSDGLDGLAGGIAAIGCVFLGTFAYMAGDWTSFPILVVLFGAILGFLRFNSHPANLFMGDAGSLLLGYSLGAVAVIMSRGSGAGADLSPVTVAGILALPITDTLLVMVRRLRHRRHPFRPDRTHLHHRLMDLGFSHAAAVPILYFGTALFGFQAWFDRAMPEGRQFLFIVLLAAMIHGAVFAAQRMDLRWDVRAPGGNGSDPHSRMARILGKSVRPVEWTIGVAFLLPSLAVGAMSKAAGIAALGLAACGALLFPWNRKGPQRAAVCYGLIFASCLFLLSWFQFSSGRPRWLPGYFALLSFLVLCWVLLKMRYRGHREILLFSGFETLIISIAIAIPLVLFPALGLENGLRRTMLVVCFEALSVLLAMKVMIRRRHGRNRILAAVLLAAMAVVGLRGIIGSGTLTASETPGPAAAGVLPASTSPPR
ncbi:MAG: hypothetical protein Kow00128_15930 [Deltaproteobacteria bacterium]